jgi:hypothetical protein
MFAKDLTKAREITSCTQSHNHSLCNHKCYSNSQHSVTMIQTCASSSTCWLYFKTSKKLSLLKITKYSSKVPTYHAPFLSHQNLGSYFDLSLQVFFKV